METNGTNRLVGDSYARFSLIAEGLAESTKSQYDFYLAKFLDWLEMDAEEFKEKAEESLRSERSEDRLWVGHQLAKYQIYMRARYAYALEFARAFLRY